MLQSASMPKKNDNEFPLTFTNLQFEELTDLLKSYLKITALNNIKENEIEKNVWILYSAKYNQDEIARILHLSQSTISRTLTGRAETKKEET